MPILKHPDNVLGKWLSVSWYLIFGSFVVIAACLSNVISSVGFLTNRISPQLQLAQSDGKPQS